MSLGRSLIVGKTNHDMRIEAIPLKQISDFRLRTFSEESQRKYPGALALSLDRYDQTALHVVCVSGGAIIGSSRLIRAHDNLLPFSADVPDVAVGPNDWEMSRFVVGRQGSGAWAFFYLLLGIAEVVRRIDSNDFRNMFADVILQHPRTLKRETYIEFGFRSLERTYYDPSYDVISEIFVLDAVSRPVFMNRVLRLSSAVGRFTVPSDKDFAALLKDLAML